MGQADSAPAAPGVSVVLAVYNGEQYLGTTLRSVLAQTYADFELVIVNDGSTDRSREIALSFNDPRIRVLDNPQNMGLTPSLNRGVREARGEFVARIDADDLWAPAKLARQVDFLRRRPDIALVGTHYRAIDGAGRELDRGQFPVDHVELRWALMFYCAFTHSAVMWRRVAVQAAVGDYDEQFAYAMDWEYWGRIAASLRVATLPRHLTGYRQGPHSMSSTHPRVFAEIRAAREASIRAVLGPGADPWIGRGQVLFPIMDGWSEDPEAAQVRATVESVRELHAAFAAAADPGGRSAASQTAWADAWIARRLLTSARKAHLKGRRGTGSLLFREAARVTPRCIATFNFGRYLAASALSTLQSFRQTSQGSP